MTLVSNILALWCLHFGAADLLDLLKFQNEGQNNRPMIITTTIDMEHMESRPGRILKVPVS